MNKDLFNMVIIMNKELETSNLIKQYINIINTVLSKQKHMPVLQGVVLLLENAFSMKDINIDVVDEADHFITFFATRFANGQFSPAHPGIAEPDIQLKVKQSYLQEVTEHAEEYIKYPLKLDLDWLMGQIEINKDH